MLHHLPTNAVSGLHESFFLCSRPGHRRSKVFGREDEEEKWIKFVPDRKFNDLRYTINSSKLHELGWVEQMSWEEGLAITVDWYKQYSGRYGNIDAALVAHPRIVGVSAADIDEAYGNYGA
jgi:dTDP-D-glucose 4,6-dehydratase